MAQIYNSLTVRMALVGGRPTLVLLEGRYSSSSPSFSSPSEILARLGFRALGPEPKSTSERDCWRVCRPGRFTALGTSVSSNVTVDLELVLDNCVGAGSCGVVGISADVVASRFDDASVKG